VTSHAPSVGEQHPTIALSAPMPTPGTMENASCSSTGSSQAMEENVSNVGQATMPPPTTSVLPASMLLPHATRRMT